MLDARSRAPFAVVAAMFAMLLGGCPARLYSLHANDLPPGIANVAPDARVATWQRAVVVLLEQGYVPQVLNETAGYISARRRDDLVDDALAGTVALVTVSPDGVVRVALAGTGTFHSQQDFLHAMSDRQAQLLAAIAIGTATTPAGAAPGAASGTVDRNEIQDAFGNSH